MQNAKRLVMATLFGALTLSATGYAVFGLALPDFYTGFLNAGSATGVERQPFLVWAVAVGMPSYGALMALVIGSRPDRLRISTGMKTGAIVSFLLWFTADFMLYGISNVGKFTGALIDPFLEIVPGTIGGAAIAFVLAKIPAVPAMPHSSDVRSERAA